MRQAGQRRKSRTAIAPAQHSEHIVRGAFESTARNMSTAAAAAATPSAELDGRHNAAAVKVNGPATRLQQQHQQQQQTGKGKRPRVECGSEVAARRTAIPEAERMAQMTAAVSTLLRCLGEDPQREGLLKTPERMAKALLDCTKVRV